MCGIVAVLGGPAVSRLRMDDALSSLNLRGPDGRGQWWGQEGRVGLGHTRLAINDPESGSQPFHWGPDKRYTAVVNGELYGARESALGSDSWLLAQAWERHGFPNALHHLRGEFAWIVYDALERKLYAARDRFGIKPLCMAYHEGRLWLASKPFALWAAGVPAGWSDEGFWRASATQYPPLGESLFQGIHELPPATWLCVQDSGQRTTGRYWQPPVEEAGEKGDLRGEFLQSLRESVRLRARWQGTTGVMVSGGVDSASVLALARERGSPEPLHAFSVDFPGRDHFSEGELARRQCAHLGITHHTVLSLGPHDLLEGLEPSVRGSLGLMVNGHGVAKYRLAEAITKAGIRVVLTGEGADELLYGYRHFEPHLPGGRRSDPLADPAGLGILTTRDSYAPLGAVEKALGFQPHVWISKWQLGQRIQAFLRNDFLDGFRDRDPFLESLAESQVDPGSSPLQTARSLWLSTALRSYILEVLGDGCEMAHSVEGRPPFLDHKLWQMVARVPLQQIAADPGKALLREAMGDLVIPAIRSRPKHPFMAPPLGQPLLDRLEEQLVEPHPYLDPSRARHCLRRIRQLQGPDAWEWEPALLWILSSYYLQREWTR